MNRSHDFWFSVGRMVGAATSRASRRSAFPSDPARRDPGREDPGAGSPADARGYTGPGPRAGIRAAREGIGDPGLPVQYRPPGPDGGDDGASYAELASSVALSVLARALDRWLAARRPGLPRLIRGVGAGAGAALAGLIAHRMLFGDHPEPNDIDPVEECLAGAGRGLIYAGLVEPRLPGPAVFRGAVYGTAEYLASPWGGLARQLRSFAPQSRVPVLATLLDPGQIRYGPYVEFLVTGVALGALYGRSGARTKVTRAHQDGGEDGPHGAAD